jgi:hypothetical protein
MKPKYFLLYLILAALVVSCETLPDPEYEYSVVWPVSGEWWVTYKFDDGTGNIDDWYGVGYTRLLTYNTAANTTDSIWITDNYNFWQFKVKAGLNLNQKTFAVDNGTDLISDDPTTISNGRVIEREDGDSIYMEIVWASDPTTTYICSGRRVKGFLDANEQDGYEVDYGD